MPKVPKIKVFYLFLLKEKSSPFSRLFILPGVSTAAGRLSRVGLCADHNQTCAMY